MYGEQRTQKTLTALVLVDLWKPTDLLIICPKIAIGVWNHQIPEHYVPDHPIGIHVINFEQFQIHRHKWYDWGYKCHKLMVIIDEGDGIKNRGSKRSGACRTMGRRAKKRLLLTGTPIAKGREDAWAQFDFIQPGVFGTYDEFEEKYLKVKTIKGDGFEYPKVLGYKNVAEFDRIFHKYSYRITLNEARKRVGKAGIITRRVFRKIELSSRSRELYSELSEELEAEFEGTWIETPNTMTLIGKLQQLAGGWVKDAEGVYLRVGTEKLDDLREVLKTVKFPVIIVCRYINEITDIVNMLWQDFRIQPLQIRGGHPYPGKFEGDVCVMQIQSGKAIDLARSRTIIFFSCDYSLINFEQIRYRIRSFEIERVTEYFLTCNDTVDEQIYEAVVKHKDLATLVCDTYRRKYNDRARAGTEGRSD